jgi:hypothetical protein
MADLLLLLTSALLLAVPSYRMIAVACAAGFVGLSGLRAVRMAFAGGTGRPVDLMGNLIVAIVYDLARALSLVSFAGHRVRRS